MKEPHKYTKQRRDWEWWSSLGEAIILLSQKEAGRALKKQTVLDLVNSQTVELEKSLTSKVLMSRYILNDTCIDVFN